MVTVAVPQLSVAVKTAAAGTLSQDAVAFAGADDNTGAVRSLTVTVCEAVLVFPHKSVAVQVRVKT
jgi:hypothetical protein